MEKNGRTAQILSADGFDRFRLRPHLAGEVRQHLISGDDFVERLRLRRSEWDSISFPVMQTSCVGVIEVQNRRFELSRDLGPNDSRLFRGSAHVDDRWDQSSGRHRGGGTTVLGDGEHEAMVITLQALAPGPQSLCPGCRRCWSGASFRLLLGEEPNSAN